MNHITSNQVPIGSPPPQLAFALWAIRKKMEDDSESALDLLSRLKFTSVELSGFYNKDASDLRKLLERFKFKVCALHGPTINLKRSVDFHVDWARRYADVFNTDTIGIESSPSLFESNQPLEIDRAFQSVAQTLHAIAHKLAPHKIRLSYHCFEHDFMYFVGRPVVESLFLGENIPANLGLQLDTMWMHYAGFNIAKILHLPIHSMHLGERDANGQCSQLGDNPEQCLDYAKTIVASGKTIQWILENDSANDVEAEFQTEAIIAACYNNWPVFWNSANHGGQSAVDEAAESARLRPREKPNLRSKLIERSQMLCELLSLQISEAMREHLFGETKSLPWLDWDDPRVKYYVSKRESAAITAGKTPQVFPVENAFYAKFWHSSRGRQIIQVIGGGGSGKTTFLRFFFQYFLPYKKRLMSEFNKQNPPLSIIIHEEHAHKHLVLYADLRRAHSQEVGGIRTFLFKRLRDSLLESYKNQALQLEDADTQLYQESDEEWVIRNCDYFARLSENGSRKWYVSWFIDNADYLSEEEQKALISIVKDFVPEVLPKSIPSDPITDKKWMLWRVIIPLRPETLENLSSLWSPLEADRFELGVLDFDELHETRGNLLHAEISGSEMHVGMDRFNGAVKAYFDVIPPNELAAEMSEAWKIATNLKMAMQNVISPEARHILEQLSHDSARRRIMIFARAGLSHCFMVRYKRSQIEQWRDLPFVSDFFLFHGLLCGGSIHFEPEIEGLPIVNVFDLGASAGTPHSIMIGSHSLYLLNQDYAWNTVKEELLRVGYDATNIARCERKYINKEILKPLFNGEFTTKLPIVNGMWQLVKERAYTDTMAVACATAWGKPSMADAFDPLDTSKLVQRFSGSVAFLKELWKAEKEVFVYKTHQQGTVGEFLEFSKNVSALGFPCITQYVGSEYLKRIDRLPQYDAPAEAIRKDREMWRACVLELQNIVKESNVPFMVAQQA